MHQVSAAATSPAGGTPFGPGRPQPPRVATVAPRRPTQERRSAAGRTRYQLLQPANTTIERTLTEFVRTAATTPALCDHRALFTQRIAAITQQCLVAYQYRLCTTIRIGDLRDEARHYGAQIPTLTYRCTPLRRTQQYPVALSMPLTHNYPRRDIDTHHGAPVAGAPQNPPPARAQPPTRCAPPQEPPAAAACPPQLLTRPPGQRPPAGGR